MIEVILVNENDSQTGTMEKMEAHRKGLLHRAFSVFIFNTKGEMLLQQRADNKYHNGGLWSNTCCSHPFPGETIMDAADRRLREEMGFNVPLTEVFNFTYEAAFDNGLTEHEFDHVLVGTYDGEINVDTTEVKDYCYKSLEEIGNAIKMDSKKFTPWFNIAFPMIEAHQKGTDSLHNN